MRFWERIEIISFLRSTKWYLFHDSINIIGWSMFAFTFGQIYIWNNFVHTGKYSSVFCIEKKKGFCLLFKKFFAKSAYASLNALNIQNANNSLWKQMLTINCCVIQNDWFPKRFAIRWFSDGNRINSIFEMSHSNIQSIFHARDHSNR